MAAVHARRASAGMLRANRMADHDAADENVANLALVLGVRIKALVQFVRRVVVAIKRDVLIVLASVLCKVCATANRPSAASKRCGGRRGWELTVAVTEGRPGVRTAEPLVGTG